MISEPRGLCTRDMCGCADTAGSALLTKQRQAPQVPIPLVLPLAIDRLRIDIILSGHEDRKWSRRVFVV